MNDFDLIVAHLVAAGFTQESSAELAYHMTLHFPEHTRALVEHLPEGESNGE
jgi:hypothetical protein